MPPPCCAACGHQYCGKRYSIRDTHGSQGTCTENHCCRCDGYDGCDVCERYYKCCTCPASRACLGCCIFCRSTDGRTQRTVAASTAAVLLFRDQVWVALVSSASRPAAINGASMACAAGTIRWSAAQWARKPPQAASVVRH